MRAEFILKPSELEEGWIMALKRTFKGQPVEMKLVVTSLNDKNSGQSRFRKAVEDVRNRSNLVSFTLDEFKAYSRKLSATK